MTLADVDAGLRLCRQSHWNQVARDWEQFLRLVPGGATVAVDNAGLVVGSLATMRYAAVRGMDVRLTPDSPHPTSRSRVPSAESLAWLAMVLVDPACRGRGVAMALLRRGLAQVADVAAVGLDATPLGQSLYEKLGFEAGMTLTRMHREAAPCGGTFVTTGVRAATPEDLAEIGALDALATGLERRAMLAWLHDGAPGFTWVAGRPGRLHGALLGRVGHLTCHLGPLSAASTDVALALVAACLVQHPDRAFSLDAADDRPGWRAGVEALGFRAQRPFTRMYRGRRRPRGDATHLFASIGPEFG